MVDLVNLRYLVIGQHSVRAWFVRPSCAERVEQVHEFNRLGREFLFLQPLSASVKIDDLVF